MRSRLLNTAPTIGRSRSMPVSFSMMLARIRASSADFSGVSGARSAQAWASRSSMACAAWRSTVDAGVCLTMR